LIYGAGEGIVEIDETYVPNSHKGIKQQMEEKRENMENPL